YDVPGSSSPPAVQVRLSPVIVPLMLPDFELTETEVRVPFFAVTVTRWSTGTEDAPLATLVCRTGWGTSGATDCECSASWRPPLPCSDFESPLPQAVATSDTASRVPTSMGTRARVTDIRLPVG